jgi:monomeric sarcosine oxidase
MGTSDDYDCVVVGAGVFGSWTAYHLARGGQRVAIVDAYGPGNSRASSGGETRVIRCAYGANDTYTRWAARSLEQWKALLGDAQPSYFHETGVLSLVHGRSAEAFAHHAVASLRVLAAAGVPHERLERADLKRRFPQFNFGQARWAIHEPAGGAIMARRSVQRVVAAAIAAGASYVDGRVNRIAEAVSDGPLKAVSLADGRTLRASAFVFACGPWLPKICPAALAKRIFPTRQEVFYVGPPPGDARFSPPDMPVWIDFADEVYGLPDIEHKGVKFASDRHGSPFDPDTGGRVVSPAGGRTMRNYVARRFPALARQPFVASEVCQYENTSNGDFLIDRHPTRRNIWLVGGGSGHGFKHGPMVGQYVAEHLTSGMDPEPLFAYATKAVRQRRSVF